MHVARTARRCACKPRILNAVSYVEVLIVIAVIVMLMAILLPSLEAAREKVRRIVCANNLRQFGNAGHMYQELMISLDISPKPQPLGLTLQIALHRIVHVFEKYKPIGAVGQLQDFPARFANSSEPEAHGASGHRIGCVQQTFQCRTIHVRDILHVHHDPHMARLQSIIELDRKILRIVVNQCPNGRQDADRTNVLLLNLHHGNSPP